MKSPKNLLPTYGITKLLKRATFFLILTVSLNNLNAQLAFPTALGAGAYTTGGRGGIVVKVTNLNATGTGSLRNALLMTVPRTIVFEVSGRINMTSLLELGVANSNFTVAGQTAPEGGITISGKPIQLGNSSQPCNNVIFRYIRFRNGSYTGQSDVYNHNGLISNGTNGLVVDHCSFSFCDDQAISMDSYYGDLRNITIQQCLFSENATQIITGLAGPYQRGDMTIINNLFADISHRTPNMGGQLQWDIINNVYFNWGNRLSNANNGSPQINNIGNYYKAGSYSSTVRANVVQNVSPSIYTGYNYHSLFYPTPQADDRNLWTSFYVEGQSLPSGLFTSTQHQLLGEAPVITSASEAYTFVTNDVGANRYLDADGDLQEYMDTYDTSKISNVVNGVSSDPYNKSWTQPSLPNNSRPSNYDSDDDGMADAWELENGLDINDASDRNDVQPDGYTNLDYFLNGLTIPTTSGLIANAGNDVTICEGASVTLTASGGVTYLWDTGATTESIEVSPNVTTTYTVTVFDATGNNSDTDSIEVTVNSIPVADAGEDVETCIGTPITLTANGGTSYSWSNGATTQSITVNPNTTTTYSVFVTQNGCTSTTDDDVVVTVNPLPNVDAGLDVTINYGGSIELTANGANSYLWNNGETTQSIIVTPTIEETYTVTGTTGSCQNSDSVTVFIIGSEVVANAGEDQTICNGSQTTLNATGGAAYVWNTGATTASIDVSPTTTTTYSVTAFDSSGTVSDTDDVTVFVNALPNVDAGINVTITEGESTTLTANGADSYQWNTGATTQSITVNPTNTTVYSVTGFSNGCESTDEVTVTVETENVVANAGLDDTICEGATVTLTASGGSTYQWNTGATTSSIEVTPNVTTTYTVTVFNTLGTSSDSDDVTVFVNALPNVDAGINVTITEGESTTLSANGADSYQWNTGATTQSITVNPTSTTVYSVTGFSNGCESTDEVTVTVETENVVANAGLDDTICEGATVTLTASGGSTYQWNTGATTSSIEVTPNVTTTYTVTVFNTLGTSSDSDDVTVFVNALPNVDAGINVTITEGESTTLTANGADSYQWNTGATTQSITVNPTSTTVYSVTGFSNGCESTDEVTVTVETENVVANAGLDDTICEGVTVTLTASGGSTYQWNTGATTSSIEVTPNVTTTYTVTVFNTLGTVSDTDDVTVFVNALPNVDAGINVTITEGESTTLTANGADSYQWNTGATTQSITVNPTSTTVYSVTGFSNGCESTDEVTVTVETENVVANAGLDDTICEGETVTLTASGGSTYQWNTGATTSSIEVTPNVTTTYTVTVFNTLGTSSDSDDVTVFVNALPNVDAGINVTITEGESTTLTANGADSYQWNTGATTQSITVNPTSTTVYSVTGFSNGCESTDEVTVTVETENVVANAGLDDTICEGATVTLTASGGSTYQWNTGATTSSIEVTPNVTTTYTVTVFNTLGTSSDSDDVTVFVNALPNVDAGINVTITEGESTTLSANGADSYQWDTGATTQSITVNPTSTTVYSVTGFSNGCESTDEVTVIVEPIVFTANAGEDQSICEGTSTTLTASEGDAYLWSTGETTQSIDVSPWATETYTVTVFEGDEQAQDDVTVFVNLNPNVVIMNGGEVTILEGEFITLSASGANTYEWNNGATQPNIAVSPSNSTIYSVTGYINNCTDNKSITVNVVETVQAFAGEDLFICENEMVTLTADGGDEYLWNTGETTQSIQVAPGTDTEYSVLVYNALSSDEDTVMVYVNDCDEEEIPQVEQEFNFLVYQDVDADVLKVQISGMDRVDVDQIIMYDLTGKIIYREQLKTNQDTLSLDKNIDSSQLSRGIYVIRLMYDDTEILKKIPIR